MKNSWNLFWSDYGKLLADSTGFCKKHWFGVLVYIAAFGLYIGAYFTGYLEGLIYGIMKAFESLKTKLTFKKGKHTRE